MPNKSLGLFGFSADHGKLLHFRSTEVQEHDPPSLSAGLEDMSLHLNSKPYRQDLKS